MFYDLLGGVTKLEAFQCYFVTKLYPLKPSPFLKIEINGKQEQPASKQIGLIGDLSQGEQQAQGAATCPEGNSMPQWKQHAKGEQHS